MDFKGLHADVNKWLSKHYTPGRRGRKIQYIGIHHNAGNLSVQGCWNVWQSRKASAHYQVQSDGIIGQLVHDCDTAWALGNFDANCRSINIEHADCSSSPWRISDKCLESGAHLVAALCLAYGLGRPAWGKNVFPHSHFSATACPASLQSSQKDAYMKRAQEWYDAMAKGGSAPAAKPSAPSGTASKYADCRWLQRIVGATADNIWGPDTGKRVGAIQMASMYHGVQFPYGVKYVQKVIGTTPDGIWGNGSKAAHDAIVKRIQEGFDIEPDGILGKDTDSHIHALHLASNHTV